MTDQLLDGCHVPWHFVSGKHEPGITVTLPPPARRNPPPPAELVPTKRLVAGGLCVAGALAAHWRKGRS